MIYPQEWRVEPFEKVARYESGRTPSRANAAYWEDKSGIPWVSIADMENYSVVKETKEKISARAFEDVFRKRISSAGTLLMSFKLTIGRVSRLGMDACHNEAIISIYPRPDVNKDYLGYFLSQVDYGELQDRQVKGNTLNQDKINRIEVALPPPDEQQTIAATLNLTRKSIETQTKALKTAQELKRAAMRELFTKGLRGDPQKQTDIGPVPESWDVVPFEKVARLFNGFAFKSTDAVLKSDIQLLRMGNLYHNNLSLDRSPVFYPDSFSETHRRFILNTGDMVISLTGTMGKEDYGFTVKIPDNLPVKLLLNQRVAKVEIINSDILSDYFFHYLLSRQFLDRLYPTAKGTKQGNLSSSIINRLLIVVPKQIEEQREIASILDAIDRKIDLHKRKKAVLEKLFKSLLHKLMNGEIRVSDLDLTAIQQLEAA